jgi:4-hydroxybutyrate---CoA ligase (AMP-forming)
MFHDLARYNLGTVDYYDGIETILGNPEGFAGYALKASKVYSPMCIVLGALMLLRMGDIFEDKGEESPFEATFITQPATPTLCQALVQAHPKIKLCVWQWSSSEMCASLECPWSAERSLSHWHVPEGLCIIEAGEPPTGKRVTEGERGTLALTSFIHLTVPLIRFDMEDLLRNTSATERCPCSRTHMRYLAPVPGRVGDLFTAKGKDLVAWEVEAAIADIPDTTMFYQLTFDARDMDAMKVKIEIRRTLPDTPHEKMVKSTLEERFAGPVEVEVVPVGALAPPPGT